MVISRAPATYNISLNDKICSGASSSVSQVRFQEGTKEGEGREGGGKRKIENIAKINIRDRSERSWKVAMILIIIIRLELEWRMKTK